MAAKQAYRSSAQGANFLSLQESNHISMKWMSSGSFKKGGIGLRTFQKALGSLGVVSPACPRYLIAFEGQHHSRQRPTDHASGLRWVL